MPNEIHPGGSINIEIDVVNHEDRVLDPNTNKFRVYVCRVVLDTTDNEWHLIEEDKYWNNLPQLKWIDEEIGADIHILFHSLLRLAKIQYLGVHINSKRLLSMRLIQLSIGVK